MVASMQQPQKFVTHCTLSAWCVSVDTQIGRRCPRTLRRRRCPFSSTPRPSALAFAATDVPSSFSRPPPVVVDVGTASLQRSGPRQAVAATICRLCPRRSVVPLLVRAGIAAPLLPPSQFGGRPPRRRQSVALRAAAEGPPPPAAGGGGRASAARGRPRRHGTRRGQHLLDEQQWGGSRRGGVCGRRQDRSPPACAARLRQRGPCLL